MLILKDRVASKKTKKLRELANFIDEMMEEQFPSGEPTTPAVTTDRWSPRTNQGPLSHSTLEALRNAIHTEIESRGPSPPKSPGPRPGMVGRGLVGPHAEQMQEHDLNTLREHGANTGYENKRPSVGVIEHTPGDAFETLPVPRGGRTKRKKREEGEYGRGQTHRGQKFYNPGDDTPPWVRDRLLEGSELSGEHRGGVMMPKKVTGTRHYDYTSERTPYHGVSPPGGRATTPEPQPPTPLDYEEPLQVTRQPRPGTIGVAESTKWEDRPDARRSLVRVKR